MNASLAVDSTGVNFDLLMQGLTGRAQIAVVGGSLENIDLIATAQQAISTRPGTKITIVRGTTAFDQLNLDLHLAKGIAEIDQGQLRGPDIHLGLSGSADLGNRRVELSALGNTVAPGDRRRIQSTPIRFNLTGPWDDAHMVQARPDLRLRPIPPQIDPLPNSPMTFSPTSQ
jgi:AsmA protein